DAATDHAALVAPVQRGGDRRGAPLSRPSLPDRPRLSPGLARTAPLRGPPPPRDAPGDTALPLRPHLPAALSLGPSLPVHALRWAAAEAPDRAHRRPVLWRRHPWNGHDGVPAVDHLVANARRSGHRTTRFLTEAHTCRGISSSRIRPP